MKRVVICELWDTPAEVMTIGKTGRRYTHCMKFTKEFETYEEMEVYARENGYFIRWWWYKRKH